MLSFALSVSYLIDQMENRGSVPRRAKVMTPSELGQFWGAEFNNCWTKEDELRRSVFVVQMMLASGSLAA